jgi:hypothetical protein
MKEYQIALQGLLDDFENGRIYKFWDQWGEEEIWCGTQLDEYQGVIVRSQSIIQKDRDFIFNLDDYTKDEIIERLKIFIAKYNEYEEIMDRVVIKEIDYTIVIDSIMLSSSLVIGALRDLEKNRILANDLLLQVLHEYLNNKYG